MDALQEIAFVGHGSEVDHRSGAAPDGTQRVVGGTCVGRSGNQLTSSGLNVGGGVGVGFDTTRHHNLPSSIDDGGVFLGQQSWQPNCGNLFAGYADVPLTNSRWGYHTSAFDNHIQHGYPPCGVRAIPYIHAFKP